jgi:type 1 glutamine amidotransferase
MKKNALLVFFSCASFSMQLQAQTLKVLHYTETSGFDHSTRSASLAMFTNLCEVLGCQVDDDQSGEAFNSVENLAQYNVVVFSNTSGDAILNADQRQHFEAYINGGGAYLGIHAASDTYRHTSANGGNTGTWDWYAELSGASVQQNPNHTAANFAGTLVHATMHPILNTLPDPWNKVEEYYYWELGYLNPENTDLLTVQPTGINSYDAARPMAWYRELPNGAKSFYTALGHAVTNFSTDDNFINLIENALLWIFEVDDLSTVHAAARAFSVFPNPSNESLQVEGYHNVLKLELYSITGQPFRTAHKSEVYTQDLPKGNYLLRIHSDGGLEVHKVVLK